MNRKQKACLLVSIAVIVVMGLYPPWVIQSKEITHLGNRLEVKYTTEPGPYSWINNPPVRTETKPNPYVHVIAHPKAIARFIDLYRLGLQYFVVAVVTAGLITFLKDRKRSKGA